MCVGGEGVGVGNELLEEIQATYYKSVPTLIRLYSFTYRTYTKTAVCMYSVCIDIETYTDHTDLISLLSVPNQ